MGLLARKLGNLDIRTKLKLAEYAENLKNEWNEEKARLKPKWDAKKKKHIRPEPKWGYIRKTEETKFKFKLLLCLKFAHRMLVQPHFKISDSGF